MKKRSEKQQDIDKLKNDLAKVSTVILTTDSDYYHYLKGLKQTQ